MPTTLSCGSKFHKLITLYEQVFSFMYYQLLSLIDHNFLSFETRKNDVLISTFLYHTNFYLSSFSVNKIAPNVFALLNQKGALIIPLFCLPFVALFPGVQFVSDVWDDQNTIPKMA